MRSYLLIAFIWLYAASMAAQLPTGTIAGTVKFDDGTPYADAYISIRTGDQLRTALSQKNGTFTAQAIAGSGTIYVATINFPVSVKAGQTTRVALVLRRDHGVIVQIRYPNARRSGAISPVGIARIRATAIQYSPFAWERENSGL